MSNMFQYFQMISDAPIPLATKIYHLQGNHHLRLALGHLYRQASVKEHGGYSLSADLVKDKDLLPSQIGSHKTDVSQKKVCGFFSC